MPTIAKSSIKQLQTYITYQESAAKMMLHRAEFLTTCGEPAQDALDGHDEANILIGHAKAELERKQHNAAEKLAQRIATCQEHANDGFWEIVVSHFPECKTGDFMMDCDTPQLAWIKHWVSNNKP